VIGEGGWGESVVGNEICCGLVDMAVSLEEVLESARGGMP
jgi:hypothetical protein